MFIAIMNMFGVVPYTFSVTSHMVVTFGLSLSIFLGCVILGLINFRSQFFAMFMPNGSPLGMAPFLVVVEIISFVARALSLGLRLAANITAGHLLLAIISGFA
jgi:F-type H+-transporting ATPase subunit a